MVARREYELRRHSPSFLDEGNLIFSTRKTENSTKEFMKSVAIIFPFDLFGSSGTGQGAQLLGDALREMLADARKETKPARSQAYRDYVKIKEYQFETITDFSSWRKTARQAIRPILKQKDFFFWFAGNHLAVLPVYEELGKNSFVIQLDAHLDIYNLSDCTEELSHGNFLLHSEGDLPEIVNLGHRDLFLPSDHVAQYYTEVFPAAKLLGSNERCFQQIAKRTQKADRIFVDIDCDVFDPSFFSATPHPLPFGVAPSFVLQLLQTIGWERICGISISEFDPGRDDHDQSLSTLIWLLEWVLLQQYERSEF
jgi:agmatinase